MESAPRRPLKGIITKAASDGAIALAAGAAAASAGQGLTLAATVAATTLASLVVAPKAWSAATELFYRRKQRAIEQFTKILNADFDHSALARHKVHQFRSEAVRRMRLAGLLHRKQEEAQFSNAADLSNDGGIWLGKIDYELLGTLRSHSEPFRIATPYYNCAVAASLLYMRDVLNIDLAVDLASAVGVHLLKRIGNNLLDVDFLVTADTQVLLAAIPSICQRYTHLLPCFFTHQFVLRKKGPGAAGRIRRLFIDRESAQEEQFRNKIRLPKVDTSDSFDSTDAEDLIKEIDGDDGALIWHPLSTELTEKGAAIADPETGYSIINSIYVQTQWGKRSPLKVEAFLRTFVAVWTYLCEHRAEAVTLLVNNQQFVKNWMAEVAEVNIKDAGP